MDALRDEIKRRVQHKRANTARVEADIVAAAGRLEAAGGTAPPRDLPIERVRELEDVVANAAGVPVVVEGIERTVGTRARRAVAWPPLALLGGRGDQRSDRDPQVAPVDRATVDTAVRDLADEVTDGMGPGWAASVRQVASARLGEVDDGLDRELAEVDLRGRLPLWVALIRLLHWLVLTAFVGGLVWWGVAALQGSLQDLPEIGGLQLPPVVAAGGLVLGLLLALLGGLMVRGLARRRAEAADERLREVVQRVLEKDVVGPIGVELTAYEDFRRGITAARS